MPDFCSVCLFGYYYWAFVCNSMEADMCCKRSLLLQESLQRSNMVVCFSRFPLGFRVNNFKTFYLSPIRSNSTPASRSVRNKHVFMGQQDWVKTRAIIVNEKHSKLKEDEFPFLLKLTVTNISDCFSKYFIFKLHLFKCFILYINFLILAILRRVQTAQFKLNQTKVLWISQRAKRSFLAPDNWTFVIWSIIFCKCCCIWAAQGKSTLTLTKLASCFKKHHQMETWSTWCAGTGPRMHAFSLFCSAFR